MRIFRSLIRDNLIAVLTLMFFSTSVMSAAHVHIHDAHDNKSELHAEHEHEHEHEHSEHDGEEHHIDVTAEHCLAFHVTDHQQSCELITLIISTEVTTGFNAYFTSWQQASRLSLNPARAPPSFS